MEGSPSDPSDPTKTEAVLFRPKALSTLLSVSPLRSSPCFSSAVRASPTSRTAAVVFRHPPAQVIFIPKGEEKVKMPLYDCMLLLKSRVARSHLKDLVVKVGRHVYTRNGILTDIKSFGTVQLGYAIKKLDGRHYQGQLMQVTMMVPPSFPKELRYLNKEDRLLRWLVVKHRGVKYGIEFLSEEEGKSVLCFPSGNLTGGTDEEDSDSDEDDDEDDEEFGDEQVRVVS